MKTVKLKSQWGCEYEVMFTLNNYLNNDNLYVGLMCFDTEFNAWVPYADITVNTDTVLNGNRAAVDTNNNGQEIVGWLLENGFATDDDFEMPVVSGFCVYPVLKFDLIKIKEYLYDGR